MRLAQTSSTPQARLHYANLAKTWLILAGDLDEMDAQQKAEHAPWPSLGCFNERSPPGEGLSAASLWIKRHIRTPTFRQFDSKIELGCQDGPPKEISPGLLGRPGLVET